MLLLAPHRHVLAPDGVWVVEDNGALALHALAEPTLAEIAHLAERTAARLERVLSAHGKSFEEPFADSEPLWLEPVLRVMGPEPRAKGTARPALVAEARGVNVHAERVVDGRDRAQLERLCRYLARPPPSHDRLSKLPDGRLCTVMGEPITAPQGHKRSEP